MVAGLALTGLFASLPAFAYTQQAITGMSPTSGPVGTVVTITGSGFTGSNQAWVGNAHDAAINVINDSTVTVTVPADATSGGFGVLNPQ